MTTPRSESQLLVEGQALAHITVNEAIFRLDIIGQLKVEQIGLNTPPVSPSQGQAWVTGGTPTGDWANHPDMIAVWLSGWRFITIKAGFFLWDVNTSKPYVYNGAAFAELALEP